MITDRIGLHSVQLLFLIITITIFSDLIDALTALFFTNYSEGLRSDSEIGQLAVIGQLHQPIILSALGLIHQSHNLSQLP